MESGARGGRAGPGVGSRAVLPRGRRGRRRLQDDSASVRRGAAGGRPPAAPTHPAGGVHRGTVRRPLHAPPAGRV